MSLTDVLLTFYNPSTTGMGEFQASRGTHRVPCEFQASKEITTRHHQRKGGMACSTPHPILREVWNGVEKFTEQYHHCLPDRMQKRGDLERVNSLTDILTWDYSSRHQGLGRKPAPCKELCAKCPTLLLLVNNCWSQWLIRKSLTPAWPQIPAIYPALHAGCWGHCLGRWPHQKLARPSRLPLLNSIAPPLISDPDPSSLLSATGRHQLFDLTEAPCLCQLAWEMSV